MSKKFATTAITNELKGSAWFRQPESDTPPPEKSSSKPEDKGEGPDRGVRLQEEPMDVASKLESKQARKLASYNASMLAIAPFSEEDIAELRRSTYNQLNVRGTEEEVEWLKDITYQLNKEIKRGKVSQADVVRVGLRLFQKLADADRAELIKILEQIK